MHTHDPDHPKALLAETDWLIRLSRRLVRADPEIDPRDLSQETALRAIQGGIGHGSWRPWLFRVADNLRRRTLRRESSRHQAEHGAAKSEPAAAADEILIQVELQQRVATALLALDEPYRTAILLRYWDDLPPRTIAARLKIPTETVRTRLKRGLAQLRGRLESEYGNRAAWLVPMSSWAARDTGIAATGTAVLSLLSIMKHSTALPLLALGLTVAGFTWASAATGSPSDNPIPVATARTSGTTTARAGDQEIATPEKPNRRIAAAGDAKAKALRIVGRCLVSGSREPLPDCVVSIEEGRALLSQDRIAPAALVRSGGDGRFALTLPASPTSRVYDLLVAAKGRATMRTAVRGNDPESAGTLDLGDIEMVPGHLVEGRLVDLDGLPRANALLHVSRVRSPSETATGPLPVAWTGVRTDEDGRFTLSHLLTHGRWVIRAVYPDQLAPPSREHHFELTRECGTLALELICHPVRETIEGIVVDASRLPVAGVVVVAGAHRGSAIGLPQGPRTDSRGRFRVPRLPNDPARCQVLAFHPGYDSHGPGSAHAWGARDVEITLHRRTALDLAVVDEDGTPVESFLVHWDLRVPQGGGTSGTGTAVDSLLPRSAAAGENRIHPDGKVRLTRLPRGEITVWIEPRDGPHAPSARHTFAIPGDRTGRIRLPRAVSRRLLVTDRRGLPVTGSRVELLRPEPGTPVSLRSPARRRSEAPGPVPQATLLVSGETDATGLLILREAPQDQLVLRIHGEHQPLLVPRVALAEGLDDLRVKVSQGATLFGRLGPAEFLAEHQVGRLPGMNHASKDPRIAAILRGSRLGIRLVGKAGTEGRHPADGTRIPCDAEGRFELRGIPFGSWDLVLDYKLSGSGEQPTTAEILARVRLDDEDPVEVAADLSSLRPATLRGTVRVDGELVAQRRIQLLMRRPNLTYFGQPVEEIPITLQTDSDGRYERRVTPAGYGIVVWTPDGKTRIRGLEEVEVAPGTEVTQHFAVERQKVAVQILDGEGRPVAKRRFQVWFENRLGGTFTTDDQGRMTVDPAPPVSFDLRTWPTALAGQEAQLKYIRAHPYPKWTEVLIRTGLVTMPLGDRSQPQSLRLSK